MSEHWYIPANHFDEIMKAEYNAMSAQQLHDRRIVETLSAMIMGSRAAREIGIEVKMYEDGFSAVIVQGLRVGGYAVKDGKVALQGKDGESMGETDDATALRCIARMISEVHLANKAAESASAS